MNLDKDLKEAISQFCSMLPNINDLHHPLDLERLMKVAYLLFLSDKVYSDIENEIIEELSKNTRFESNESMQKQFVGDCIYPEITKMLEYLKYLDNLNLLIK